MNIWSKSSGNTADDNVATLKDLHEQLQRKQELISGLMRNTGGYNRRGGDRSRGTTDGRNKLFHIYSQGENYSTP